MRKIIFNLIPFILLFVLLSGCAFTKEYVKINYSPSSYSKQTQSTKTILIEKLKDVRGVEPNIISYKGTQFKTSGQYINDKEISELLTEKIKELLSNLGYQIGSTDGDLTLAGEVLKFDSYIISGFWSGEVDAVIQLNLKLIDSNSKSTLWNEIISGRGKKSGIQIDRWGNRQEAIEKALDELMNNIANSASLKNAIEKY